MVPDVGKDIGDIKVLTCFAYSAFILSGFGIRGNLKLGLMSSKHSFSHCISTLLPLLIIAIFFWSSLTYTQMAWTHPIVILAPMGFFFGLNCSRLIIGTVTKTQFRFFEDMHLIVPMLVSIVLFPIGMNELIVYAIVNIGNAAIYFWYITCVIG
jgi:hypothetical protein